MSRKSVSAAAVIAFAASFFLSGSRCSEEPKVRPCTDLGNAQIRCEDECDLVHRQCWQRTVMERCSCKGYLNHLAEVAIFAIEGNLLSAPGYGFIQHCDKCSDRCTSLKANQSWASSPFVDGSATNRKYKKSDKKLEDCKDSSKTSSNRVDDGIQITPYEASNGHIDKMEVVNYADPKLGKSCQDKGNLTRLCVEQCPLDGVTCITSVDIDACTCAGRHLKLNEVAKYDMKTKKRVFEGTPLEQYGYSRVCGDCTDFCEMRQGERNEYYVNDFITTCFDASKLKPA